MKKLHSFKLFVTLGAVLVASANLGYAAEPVKVTVFNFERVESDMQLDRYVKQGAFGKLFHISAQHLLTSKMSSGLPLPSSNERSVQNEDQILRYQRLHSGL